MTHSTKKDLTGATRLTRAVYFVGGIDMECSVDSVKNRDYCEERNVTFIVRVASCRFLPSKIFGIKCARLSVSADDADRQGIHTDGFWPEHLSFRPWYFDQFGGESRAPHYVISTAKMASRTMMSGSRQSPLNFYR